MVVVTDQDYRFPDAPDPDAMEWPGTPLGISNVITRTKSRTELHDKVVDATAGLLDELRGSAETAIALSRPHVTEHDAVIHGLRVRAHTNSPHLADFWQANWYSVAEWERLTGTTVPSEVAIDVFAVGNVPGQREAAYFSRSTSTVIFFNTAYYGQLKSWVLGAAGRILADRFGIHSVHGACVEFRNRGVLYVAPTGTGKSTSSYGLMGLPGTRFHSDDWVYIRYVHTTRDGLKLAPIEITTGSGEVIRGYRCVRWLEYNHPEGCRIQGLDLSGCRVEVGGEDLDTSVPLEAYAYISEKVFYLRSNLVENFPRSAVALFQSKLENVPDISDHFLREHKEEIHDLVAELNADPGLGRRAAELVTSDDLAEQMARLFAFDNSRAMLDPKDIFSTQAAYLNPMEPLQLGTVILLKRNFGDQTVLDRLDQDHFLGRLIIGTTPDAKREVAYNAYRAVDDDAEREFISRVEAEAATEHMPLYRAFQSGSNRPASLDEEFDLFRAMHRSAKCYELNTILQRDPQVSNRKQAVKQTIDLITRTLEVQPNRRLSLQDYREFLR